MGAYGCQCVDLVMAYFDYLVGYHISGNAYEYATKSLPSGWTRVYGSPQAGDIAVWGKGVKMNAYGETSNKDYGHIGLVSAVNSDGTITTVETNALSGSAAHYYQRWTSSAACYIHPDFKTSGSSSIDSGVSTAAPSGYQNLGQSFDAYIIRSDVWQKIKVDADKNVELAGSASEGEGRARYLWHFERQGDGTYIITSYYFYKDNLALDVEGAGTSSGTNVEVYTKWGTDNGAQKWYLVPNSTAYELVPKCNTRMRLDVYNGNTAEGTNIQLWEANGTAAQTFSIYKVDDVVAPTSISCKDSYEIEVGETLDLASKVSVQPSNTNYGSLHYSDDNKGGVECTASGKVTGLKAGYRSCVIISFDFDPNINKVVYISVKAKSGGSLTVGQTASIGKVTYKVTSGKTAAVTGTVSKDVTSVSIPNTVKINGVSCRVTAISANAFKNCKKLKTVTIGSNVTKIGAKAFANCKKLKTVTIGKKVKSIGKLAFYKCTSLKKLVIKSKLLKTSGIGSKAFTGCKKMTVYVPKSKYSSYKKVLISRGVPKKSKFKKLT